MRKALGAVVLATALAVLGATPASAAVTIPGCTGTTVKYGIITSGSHYKTRVSSTQTRNLSADVRWRAPYAGAPLVWYNGAPVAGKNAYSPGVANSNYPSAMAGGAAGYGQSQPCAATQVAVNY